MEEPSLGATSKTVLILVEDISLESVDDKIVALGHTFQKRTPFSKPFQWREFEKNLKELRTSGNLLAILFFLSKEAFFNSCSSEGLSVWHNILVEMKSAPSLVFIQEDNFRRVFYDDDLNIQIQETRNLLLDFIGALNLIRDSTQVDYFGSNVDDNDVKRKTLVIDDLIEKILQIIFTINRILTDLKEIDLMVLDKYANHIYNSIQNNLIEIMNKRALIKEVIVDKNEGLKKDILLKFDYLKSVDSLCRELEQLLENLQRVSLNKLSAQSQRAKQLLDTIQASGVEVVPYTKKREISLRVHHFLDETDKGIVFHLYVPNGRYQEDQLASFLRLFVSYLQRVEKLQFFIDTRRTLHGQVYEFKSKNTTMNLTDMEGAFSRFGDFISLCQNDYKQAEAILVNMGINSREASNLITKYIKDYQRLMLDTRHELEQKTFEFEQKRLALRQRLESTAFELANGGDLSLTDTTHPSAFLSLVNNFGSISVNLQNPSFYINSGEQQIFEQIFNGDIHYTSEDKQLIDLFEKHAERLESVLLKSDLDQLKDTSSSEAERKTAKQKIVSFLSRVAPAIGQSALTVLTAYLEKILTGS